MCCTQKQAFSLSERNRKRQKKLPLRNLSEKAGDYIGKNNPVDEVLYGQNGIVDKIDNYEYNNIHGDKAEEIFLQTKLNYEINGEKLFIPEQTKFENVVTIAGNGAKKPLREAKRLVSYYGGKEDEWKKQAGKINSDKFIFDIHWYELDSIQYEVKLKNRSNKNDRRKK